LATEMVLFRVKNYQSDDVWKLAPVHRPTLFSSSSAR
jgi:hypothetical protein